MCIVCVCVCVLRQGGYHGKNETVHAKNWIGTDNVLLHFFIKRNVWH